MKKLVQWTDKEMKCALPLPISEDGDTVPLEDICEQLATLYDVVGDLSLEILQEICEAERAGRCVVLPCKPSDYDIIGDITQVFSLRLSQEAQRASIG